MVPRSSVVAFVVFTAFVGLAQTGCAATRGPSPVLATSVDLAAPTSNEKGTVVLAALRGRVVVVQFFASWCAASKKALPELAVIAARRGPARVAIVAISEDESAADAAGFAEMVGLDEPIVWDEANAIASAWALRTVPSTFVLDGHGRVRYVQRGWHPGDARRLDHEIQVCSEGGTRR